MSSLRITEIFYSLQGESRTSGLPTVFVRLTGCPLRCQYCDSEYAFHGGNQIALDDIMAQVASYNPRYICVTGGEPLAQPNAKPLMTMLCDAGYDVSIETSGAMDISEVDDRVSIVMDLKTPDSKEESRNRLANLLHLKQKDQIKFVICSRVDYDWAKSMISDHNLASLVGDVLMSPSWGQVDATELADWIVADNLPVRYQIQMHKVLWADEPGR